MAITKKAIASQQKTHTYFFFVVNGDKISALLAALPDYARVQQFTGGPYSYRAWGTYHGDRQKLLDAVTGAGGFGFSTQADFLS